jgi:hypothetical protein
MPSVVHPAGGYVRGTIPCGRQRFGGRFWPLVDGIRGESSESIPAFLARRSGTERTSLRASAEHRGAGKSRGKNTLRPHPVGAMRRTARTLGRGSAYFLSAEPDARAIWTNPDYFPIDPQLAPGVSVTTPTVNGQPTLSGSITEQSCGVWHAEAALDSEEAPNGAITLELDDGVQWLGTVLRSRVEHGQVRVKVIGGAGRLSTGLPAKNYAKATAAAVLSDILREAGETLASSSASGLSSHQLSNWHREEATAGLALTALAAELGLSWRVLRDGTVWLGKLAWAETTAAVTELDSDWAAGTFELVDALGLEPGTTYQGHPIHQVTHFIESSSIRTEARVTSSSGVLERLLSKVRRELDRCKVWPGTVARQSAEEGYPVDILPDGKDARVRGQGLGHVQQLVGLPGFTVQVPEGARGAWTMLGGDPSRPRWIGWEQGGAAHVTELCFAGGTHPVARKSDTTDEGELIACSVTAYPVATPGGPGTITGPVITSVWYRPSHSGSWTKIAEAPGAGTEVPPTPAQSGTTIVGTITSGNLKLLA